MTTIAIIVMSVCWAASTCYQARKMYELSRMIHDIFVPPSKPYTAPAPEGLLRVIDPEDEAEKAADERAHRARSDRKFEGAHRFGTNLA